MMQLENESAVPTTVKERSSVGRSEWIGTNGSSILQVDDNGLGSVDVGESWLM